MIVREADRSDLPEVVEIWKELMDFHKNLDPLFTRSADGPGVFQKHLEKQIESADDVVLVAEDSGRILGYAKIGISHYPPVFLEDKYGLISDAAVRKEYRRSGIGQALVTASTEWFARKGVTRVELRVVNANKVGTGFWTRMGFKPYITTMFKEQN